MSHICIHIYPVWGLEKQEMCTFEVLLSFVEIDYMAVAYAVAPLTPAPNRIEKQGTAVKLLMEVPSLSPLILFITFYCKQD
jgi:S-adenosylmethionine/arginine decarboxylase-like enzyme